jgi:hypothetical protein
MRFILIIFISLALISCTKKDCSSIDLSTLADIKLTPDLHNQAATVEDFMRELDRQLHRTHKLIMQCRSEDDFEQDKVLPGVMLWISDSWDLRNDTSKLGLFFYQHGIDPWERTRVAGILYHRHLNDLDLQTEPLLRDAQIRSEYHGRIQSNTLLNKLDEREKKILLAKIVTVDSFMNKLNVQQLSIPAKVRRKNDFDKIMADRYKIITSLNKIIQDVEDNKPEKEDIKSLQDISYQKSFEGFNDRSPGQKLILIETIRFRVLSHEKKILDHEITTIEEKHKVTSPTK